MNQSLCTSYALAKHLVSTYPVLQNEPINHLAVTMRSLVTSSKVCLLPQIRQTVMLCEQAIICASHGPVSCNSLMQVF